MQLLMGSGTDYGHPGYIPYSPSHWGAIKLFPGDLPHFLVKLDKKIGTKYQRSPFYIGSLLCNDLNAATQFARDIIQFKQLIGKKYSVYEKLI